MRINATVIALLMQAIIILWGLEQVLLGHIERGKFSAYVERSLAIAFIAACVSVVAVAARAPIGAVLVGVIAVHGLLTAPLLLAWRPLQTRRMAMGFLSSKRATRINSV